MRYETGEPAIWCVPIFLQFIAGGTCQAVRFTAPVLEWVDAAVRAQPFELTERFAHIPLALRNASPRLSTTLKPESVRLR